MLYVEIIMVAGIILLQFFVAPLIAVFGLSDETAKLCILAFRIISLGLLKIDGHKIIGILTK